MVNYSMKYGVEETARYLKIERDLVKTWSHLFSDYLSTGANPGKGKQRKFTATDIRVFAYILMYWCDDPDIEEIKYGLSSNSHYDNELIDDFITGITPLFCSMPEEIDETWPGVVFGGEFELQDIFATAKSFKLAGDTLVDIALKNYEERELFQPAIYNYRHATELYIKSVVGEERNHNLVNLLEKFRATIKNKFKEDLPIWFENIIKAFDYSDPNGEAFRYGVTYPRQELYADISHIKKQMNWLSKSFERIKRAEKM